MDVTFRIKYQGEQLLWLITLSRGVRYPSFLHFLLGEIISFQMMYNMMHFILFHF